MTTHRDSIQQRLDGDNTTDFEIALLRERVNKIAGKLISLEREKQTCDRDTQAHLDRMYERLYTLWDWMEKASDCIASPPPLPLKYK